MTLLRMKNNFLPAVAWIVFHALVVKWDFSFFSLLVFVRMSVVLGCLLIRELPQRTAPWKQRVFAWLSTALPLAMNWDAASGFSGVLGEAIVLAGVVLFTMAALDLGKSFGISPAIRTHVTDGIYRYFRNPIYISHAIVEIGIFIASPSRWNLAVLVAASVLYVVRAIWERQLRTRFRVATSRAT